MDALKFNRLIMKLIFLFMVMIFSSVSNAVEISSGVVVTSIDSVSSNRPGSQASQDLVFVRINPVDWGATDCRTNTVAISPSDKHLLSVLLTGVAMNKQLVFTVDDTLKPYSVVCQVTYISVKI